MRRCCVSLCAAPANKPKNRHAALFTRKLPLLSLLLTLMATQAQKQMQAHKTKTKALKATLAQREQAVSELSKEYDAQRQLVADRDLELARLQAALEQACSAYYTCTHNVASYGNSIKNKQP